MALPINLWLINPDKKMCVAFEQRFANLPNVRVIQSRYEDLEPHDCFVTAANAFGMMTAGIDAAIISFHGEALMKRIQLRIMNEYLGEQPVGTCMIESTDNPQYPYIGHSPTMRVPGSIVGTDKVYAATWAGLLAVFAHNANTTIENRIETVALPAMGAGFGGVPFSEVARQMAVAYEHYLNPPHRFDWDMVAARHKRIAYDGNNQVLR